jgi:alpha-galactosidase
VANDPPEPGLHEIATLAVDPSTVRVYEHGWQSWTATSTYRLDDRPPRHWDPVKNVMSLRPGAPKPPAGSFQGDGLLAIQVADGGPVHVFASTDGTVAVATIRATPVPGVDRLQIESDGPVDHRIDTGPGGIQGALARWADDVTGRLGLAAPRPAPTGWCSWYHYFTEVTEADIDENLRAIDPLDLDIEVVQIDDGYQREIGDWHQPSDRFQSLTDVSARIRATGRQAGIWVAPFLVGARSTTAAEHPEWLVRGADAPAHAGHNWGQPLYALDTTHPAAMAWLKDVFERFVEMGFSYFKIDFVYGAAVTGDRHHDVTGIEAYRLGVQGIRDAIGDAYLLGCGAPILPSLGLVDAMRISPDTSPEVEPRDGDLSEPGSRSAIVTGAARAFQHGRFWVNDPDCLIARPAMEEREAWAEHVERFGGLRASSDRLADLDDWGLETTRRLLATRPPERFVAS